MANAQGIVGIQGGAQGLAAGTTQVASIDKQGALLASELNARYYQLAYSGLLFSLDSDSVTLVAANSTKGAAATIRLANGIYNPVGSGRNAVILWVSSATVSGTPAGPLYYNAQSMGTATITNAATGTIRAAIQNTVSPGASSMVPEVNVVLTRSDAATTAFTQTGVHGGPAAIAAGAGTYQVLDEVAGRIIVPPGTVWGLAATGAGTTHIVQSTIWWAEVPI